MGDERVMIKYNTTRYLAAGSLVLMGPAIVLCAIFDSRGTAGSKVTSRHRPRGPRGAGAGRRYTRSRIESEANRARDSFVPVFSRVYVIMRSYS